MEGKENGVWQRQAMGSGEVTGVVDEVEGTEHHGDISDKGWG